MTSLSAPATPAAADLVPAVAALLDQVLHLDGRGLAFGPATPLLGSLPELDSMAVVQVIAALQERFALEFDDDELSGEAFASVGALAALVAGKGGRP